MCFDCEGSLCKAFLCVFIFIMSIFNSGGKEGFFSTLSCTVLFSVMAPGVSLPFANSILEPHSKIPAKKTGNEAVYKNYFCMEVFSIERIY